MKNKKLVLGVAGAVALVVIIVVGVIFLLPGSREKRDMEVLEAKGSCTVQRDGKTTAVSTGTKLYTGDRITVSEGGSARIRLDDDKFIYLEGGTVAELTATGNAESSKTLVYVERGSMMTEVKRKLSAASAYEIVTPNTTMSIRGTKTLTEVLEDAVTGHIKSSNAVLEGQVKIKAVKVKADGTVVSVEKDLGAGESNSFASTKEEIVSLEEMKSIADTGATTAGLKVEIVSEEDAEVAFDVAVFQESFLENVRSILVADAESETGEEGLSQEQIDAINDTLNLVMESFAIIRETSQQAINDAENGSEMPAASEPELAAKVELATIEDAAFEDTAHVDDTVNDHEWDVRDEDLLQDVGTADANEALLDWTEEDEEAYQAGDYDPVEEAADDESVADEPTDEPVADENAISEKEEDKKELKEEKKEDTDKDEKDKDDKDKEEKEKEDKTDKDKTPSRTEDYPYYYGGGDSGGSGGSGCGSGTGGSGSGSGQAEEPEKPAVAFVSNTWTVNTSELGMEVDYGEIPVKVVFVARDDSSGTEISMSSLSTAIENGAMLPGYGRSAYEAMVVPADDSLSSVSDYSDIAGSISATYAFTGWYTNASYAAANNLSERMFEFAGTQGETVNLYPGICKVTRVYFSNFYEDIGEVVLPDCVSGSAIDYINDGMPCMLVKLGDTVLLPVQETAPNNDHPYVKIKDEYADSKEFYCYCTYPAINLEELTEQTVYCASGAAMSLHAEETDVHLYMYYKDKQPDEPVYPGPVSQGAIVITPGSRNALYIATQNENKYKFMLYCADFEQRYVFGRNKDYRRED